MTEGLEKALKEESKGKKALKLVRDSFDRLLVGGWLGAAGADVTLSLLFDGRMPFGTACGQMNLAYGFTGLFESDECGKVSRFGKAKQATAVAQGMLGAAYLTLFPGTLSSPFGLYHELMVFSSLYTLTTRRPNKFAILAGLGIGLAYYGIIGSFLFNEGTMFMW